MGIRRLHRGEESVRRAFRPDPCKGFRGLFRMPPPHRGGARCDTVLREYPQNIGRISRPVVAERPRLAVFLYAMRHVEVAYLVCIVGKSDEIERCHHMDGLSGPHQTLKSALARKHMVRAVRRHSDALKHLHRKMPHKFSAFPVAAGRLRQNKPGELGFPRCLHRRTRRVIADGRLFAPAQDELHGLRYRCKILV